MRTTITLSLALVASGCATDPSRIAGVYNMGTCTSADRTRLAELVQKQRKAANADALGVFLFGVPAGSLTVGDHEAEIAVLKGRC